MKYDIDYNIMTLLAKQPMTYHELQEVLKIPDGIYTALDRLVNNGKIRMNEHGEYYATNRVS